MASQYAGWQVSVDKFFAMGSGPMRAALGSEKIFEHIPGKETTPRAVGCLETKKLPSEEVIAHLSQKLKIEPKNLSLLCAPAASMAGSVQVVARSLETALHKLHELGFDLKSVLSGAGIAPLPPIAASEIIAIGRTNDAILYGARVNLWVACTDDQIEKIGPQVPSSASKDHGSPFAEIFQRYNQNFYAIDPHLFSPAVIEFNNLTSGRRFVYGTMQAEVLRTSFGA
jgi:methenyltetrahydromethanopterin cyclohydrolase